MLSIRQAVGSTRAFISADPNLSIMPAHMLWIDRKDDTAGQAIAKASNTRVASRRLSPDPP